jgi:dienelactone hydrolase
MLRALGLLVLIVAGWHPARVAVQALLLLPAIFPSPAVDPLALVSAAPARSQLSYSYAAGTVDAELLVPAGGGRHGAIVLLLGAGDLPRSDLALRFADALARLGIVTLVPESSGMLAERMTFDEIDAVRTSLDALARSPSVDVTRVGLVGLSASGGLSIVAAGESDLRDRVHFVNSFGSYADTPTLLVDVASRSLILGGVQRSWTPEQRTLDVVRNALDDAGVSPSDRDELVDGATRERAAQILTSLPSVAVQRLARVSPIGYLRGVKAHVYLMHDQDDPFVPFTQSESLAATGLITRYTEFAIFSHVIPDRPVPWQTFVPEVWRLFWHVHAVLLEVL